MRNITFNKMRNMVFATAAGLVLLVGSSVAFAQTSNTVPASGYCGDLANRLGGLPIPNNDVCDVVVVRKAPTIKGSNGMNLNKFTLMNSVVEFTKSGMPNGQVYVMGDFALLETEMNNVLRVVASNKWTVTGIHNHMINESPKTTFMHWETQGNTDTVVNQINQAFAQTSIK
jgi:hypothetical protein